MFKLNLLTRLKERAIGYYLFVTLLIPYASFLGILFRKTRGYAMNYEFGNSYGYKNAHRNSDPSFNGVCLAYVLNNNVTDVARDEGRRMVS